MSLLFNACSDHQKMVKTRDYETKYTYAKKMYETQKYSKALPILEELIDAYRGTNKAENIYYMYAYTQYYYSKDYFVCAYYFSRFSTNFPTSKYAEECSYMSSYCYFLQSDDPDLDNTNTLAAINSFQIFVDKYPESKYVQKCNENIDNLYKKIEIKNFNNAKLRYKIYDYKGAKILLRNFIRNNSMSLYNEEAQYLIVKSAFLLAEKSIEIKKLERYQETIDAANDYVAIYGSKKGQYLLEIERYLEKSKNRIEKSS